MTAANTTAKFKITLAFVADAESSLNEVLVEAASVQVTTDWLAFHSDATPHGDNVVAMFPRERVISVVKHDSYSAIAGSTQPKSDISR